MTFARSLGLAALVSVASSLSVLSSQAAQEAERRGAFAAKVDEETPVIDGVVDDDVWFTAPVLTEFVQAEPLEGEPATERTEVRILYDEAFIYIGVICYDRDPSGIVVTDSRRDAGLNDMDSFQMVFDTYRDRQNGFVFGTNPAGIEYDGQVSKEGGGGQTSSRQRTQTGSGSGFNLNWDASFIVRAHIGEMGWMAEFAIPLRTLRYGSGKPQSWGLNFQRNIRRKREQVYWSPVSRIFNLYRLSSAGDLHGLELATPRNFKVMPYALSSANRDFSTSTSWEFVIDKSYAQKIRKKRDIFRKQTRTRKTIFIVMVTTYGTKENQYFNELISEQLTMDVLFLS